MASDDNYADLYNHVDLPAINKIVAFCFALDVLPFLFGSRPIVVSEPRLVLEGSGQNAQMVPVDRIFIARRFATNSGRASPAPVWITIRYFGCTDARYRRQAAPAAIRSASAFCPQES
jgi:hypothetical protein